MLESKEQIIQLGKILAEEQRRDCDDGAAPGGMERYLTGWRQDANGALQYPPVQQTLELLAGYSVFDETTRRARIGIALEALRALFRSGERASGRVGEWSDAAPSPRPPADSQAHRSAHDRHSDRATAGDRQSHRAVVPAPGGANGSRYALPLPTSLRRLLLPEADRQPGDRRGRDCDRDSHRCS